MIMRRKIQIILVTTALIKSTITLETSLFGREDRRVHTHAWAEFSEHLVHSVFRNLAHATGRKQRTVLAAAPPVRRLDCIRTEGRLAEQIRMEVWHILMHSELLIMPLIHSDADDDCADAHVFAYLYSKPTNGKIDVHA